MVQRPSQGELTGTKGEVPPVKGEAPPVKGEAPPAKPARPSGRVVVETLSVQKKKEKEEKGGFFANLKKKFKTGSDDVNPPVAATPPPKGPLPPGGVLGTSRSASKPPQGAQVQDEPGKPLQTRGSVVQSPMLASSPDIAEPSDVEGNVPSHIRVSIDGCVGNRMYTWGDRVVNESVHAGNGVCMWVAVLIMECVHGGLC